MTRIFRRIGVLLALSVLPSLAHAQLRPGIHVARATDTFDGSTGVGVNLQVSLPLLPVGFLFAAEHFFTGCDGCSFRGVTADAQFSIPTPLVSPYGAAGLVWRDTKVSDTTERNGGLGVGVGVNLNAVAIRAFTEARYEIMSGSGDQWVLRLGVRF